MHALQLNTRPAFQEVYLNLSANNLIDFETPYVTAFLIKSGVSVNELRDHY